jgi:hypothetical protein
LASIDFGLYWFSAVLSNAVADGKRPRMAHAMPTETAGPAGLKAA